MNLLVNSFLILIVFVLGCQSKSINEQEDLAKKSKIENIKKVGLVVSYDCEVEKVFGKDAESAELVKCEDHHITDPSLVKGNGPLSKFQSDLLGLFSGWEVKKVSELDLDQYLKNECTYKVLFFFDSVDLEKCFKESERRGKILDQLGLDALIYQKIHLTSQLEPMQTNFGDSNNQGAAPRLLSYLYFDFRLFDKESKSALWAQNEGFREVSGDEDFFQVKAQYFISSLSSGIDKLLGKK